MKKGALILLLAMLMTACSNTSAVGNAKVLSYIQADIFAELGKIEYYIYFIDDSLRYVIINGVDNPALLETIRNIRQEFKM